MKKLILISSLLLIAICGNSQDNSALNDYSPELIKNFERFDNDPIEAHILKSFNSNFKVNDSIDYFIGNSDQWVFESRYKSISFDAYGNILSGATNFYNPETNSWTKKSRSFFRYTDPRNKVRDTYLKQVWDSRSLVWRDESYAKYFGVNGYTELFVKDWNFKRNCFTGGSRYSYSMNDKNLAKQRLVQKWDTVTNAWINDMRYSYSYTETNKLKDVILEIWYKNSSQWITSRKDTYFYDVSGNNTKQVIQYWSYFFGWINGYQFNNTFNEVNKTTSVITEKWNANNSKWDPIQKNVCFYDLEENLTESFIYQIEPSSQKITNYQRFIYDYDHNNDQILNLKMIWNLGQWENFAQTITTYDPKKNILSQIEQKWETDNDVWRNQTSLTNVYKGNEFNILYYSQNWNPNNNAWENIEKRQSFYSGIKNDNSNTSFFQHESNQTLNDLVTIYPNPANDKVMISCTQQELENFIFQTIRLLDRDGTLLKVFHPESNEIIIYREGLKSGTYYIQIYSPYNTISKTIVFK